MSCTQQRRCKKNDSAHDWGGEDRDNTRSGVVSEIKSAFGLVNENKSVFVHYHELVTDLTLTTRLCSPVGREARRGDHRSSSTWSSARASVR